MLIALPEAEVGIWRVSEKAVTGALPGVNVVLPAFRLVGFPVKVMPAMVYIIEELAPENKLLDDGCPPARLVGAFEGDTGIADGLRWISLRSWA